MTSFDLLQIDIQDAEAPIRLVRSLRETGFAVISGHGISAEEIEGFYTGWGDFFASAEKSNYLVDPQTQAGYFPFKSENAKGAAAKDLKEFYHVYPNGPLPPQLEERTRSIYARLLELGKDLLTWVDRESPDDVRAHYSEPLPRMLDGSDMNLLRILHYPPVQEGEEPAAVRAAAHEDINLITLLLSGSEAGLEAQDASGSWHAVPCDPGKIIINVGDMLQKASGGYFPSTTHRVVNPSQGTNVSRYSMPLFLHPRPDVRLDDDYTADGYLQERLREIGLKG